MKIAIYTIMVLFSVACLLACENDPEDLRKWVEKLESNVEEATDVEIFYSDSAIVRVKITAPRLLSYSSKSETKREFPDGVDVQFFDGDKKLQSTLTSKYAIQIEGEKKVIARDSVVLKGTDGQQLESEELIWDESKKIIYTHKFVVLRTLEEVVWGFDFEADQDFNSYARVKKVQGRLPAIKGLDESSE